MARVLWGLTAQQSSARFGSWKISNSEVALGAKMHSVKAEMNNDVKPHNAEAENNAERHSSATEAYNNAEKRRSVASSAASSHLKPLILIHGFRGAPVGLKAIQQDLAAVGYRVFVPAVPPFGDAGSLAEYTPEAYANFLADYITAQGLKQPILIGHSMGSLVAMATARLKPELVDRRIILLSPITVRPAWFFQKIAPLSASLPAEIVDYITTKYLFVAKERELFAETLRLTGECSGSFRETGADLRGAAKFAAEHAVADFAGQQQVMMIAGEKDRLIKRKDTEALAQKWNAELVILPGTGHLHNYEQPHETAQAILKLLTK